MPKKNANSRERHIFPLLELPELVLFQIFDLLELQALQTLRLVSKYAKSTVESRPSCLVKFPIKIHRLKRFKQILNSSVLFNNFSINSGKYSGCRETYDSRIDSFISKYGSSIKVFDLETGFSSSQLNEILRIAPLEVLRITGYYYQYEDFSLEPETVTALRQGHLKGVKTLRFFGGPHFKEILNSCSSLRLLNLSSEHWYRSDEDNIKKFLIESLKEYISKRYYTPGGLKRKLTIDFGELEKPCFYYDIIQMKKEDLLELTQLCYPVGIKLINVPNSLIPTLSDLRYEKTKVIHSLRCISSINLISSTTDQVLPAESQISAYLQIQDQDFTNYELTSQAHSISIMMDCWAPRFYSTTDEQFETVALKIFQNRPVLQEFSIYRDTLEPVFIARSDFTCFPNLKRLSLRLFGDTKEKFWILVESLPLLESLEILDQQFGDEYFLGEESREEPIFLGLKKLKRLKIETDEITDKCLVQVFTKMKLISLENTSRMPPSHLVTFNGLKKMLSGELGLTIEVLVMQKPIDCTMGQCKALLKDHNICKKLKQFNLNDNHEKTRSKVQCSFIIRHSNS